ncbi:hypothetical protein E2491_04640 [Jeotgalibacillus sp. R-1-5s-1]|nr:hypothetical protein E2491_04640 [Jeotgalibacillus sp. R-1-5s-1]
MVSDIERKLNITLPPEYVNSYPEIVEHSALYFYQDDTSVPIAQFYPAIETEAVNLFSMHETALAEELQEGMYPFAETVDGDWLCFYFDRGRLEEPQIIYVSRDQVYENQEEAIFPVASRFVDFLYMLRK